MKASELYTLAIEEYRQICILSTMTYGTIAKNVMSATEVSRIG